jgi:hypothetical protein
MSLSMLLKFNKLYCVLYNKYKESLYLKKKKGAIIGKYLT